MDTRVQISSGRAVGTGGRPRYQLVVMLNGVAIGREVESEVEVAMLIGELRHAFEQLGVKFDSGEEEKSYG